MPKVVTTVNLDFDEKEEFVKRYGKAELSEFLRKAIHEALKKNREALVDLSAIGRLIDNPLIDVPNQSLDYCIEYAKKQEYPQPLIEIFPKIRNLYQLTDGRIRGLQCSRKRANS